MKNKIKNIRKGVIRKKMIEDGYYDGRFKEKKVKAKKGKGSYSRKKKHRRFTS